MHLRAKPGREEDLKMILAGLPETIPKEPGCLQFDVFRNEHNSADFVCLEEWQDDAAVDTHRDSPQTAQVHRALEPLLDGGMDIRRYRAI